MTTAAHQPFQTSNELNHEPPEPWGLAGAAATREMRDTAEPTYQETSRDYSNDQPGTLVARGLSSPALLKTPPIPSHPRRPSEAVGQSTT